VNRIAFVGRLLARHGVLVLVAAISPYAATRDRLRALSRAAGHPFVEVFVHAPLETVIERDLKGLYRRAQAAEIPSFTGISDPYEPPTAPDVEVRTDREDRASCEAHILQALVDRALIPPLWRVAPGRTPARASSPWAAARTGVGAAPAESPPPPARTALGMCGTRPASPGHGRGVRPRPARGRPRRAAR
jgi:adenylylsulfate kinase